jgi:hypothetical protein
MSADQVLCKVRQQVRSTSRSRPGSWTISAALFLPIVPRTGDHLAFHLPTGGVQEATVQQVTLMSGGSPMVELHPVVTDSLALLGELDARAWDQVGP